MLVSDPHSSNLAKFMPARLRPKAPSASRASPTQAQLCGSPGCGRAAYHDGLCHNQQVARPRQRRPSTRVLTEAAEGSPLCRIPAASKKRAAPTSARRASPTFVGHNFMVKPSHSPLGSALGSGLRRVQAEAAEAEAEAEVETAEAKDTSRYRGVSKQNGRWWKARIWQAGIGDIVIGVFDNAVAAALAYDEKAREMHGRQARLNFPPELPGELQPWTPWTHEEDLKVLDGVNRHGHCWAKIARDLPELRTESSVRNHWHRLISKQMQTSALVETAAEKQTSAPPQLAPPEYSSIAEVAVPAGVLPGQQIKFVRPGGAGWIMVTVPPGVSAGQKFRVPLTRPYLRCGKCQGCVRGNCGDCKNCLDKPKFGGRDIKKQACERRACSNPQEKKESPLVKAAKAEQAKAAFCTLSNALQGDDYSCLPAARHKDLCALRQLDDRRDHRPANVQ